MFYHNRVYSIKMYPSWDAIAHDLATRSWCICAGFGYANYIVVNDSTCEDGAQEFAVLRSLNGEGDTFVLIDSLTVSWMSEGELKDSLNKIPLQPAMNTSHSRIMTEPAERHNPCRFCQ